MNSSNLEQPLTTEEVNHSTQSEYVCRGCDTSFSTNGNLTKHQKNSNKCAKILELTNEINYLKKKIDVKPSTVAILKRAAGFPKWKEVPETPFSSEVLIHPTSINTNEYYFRFEDPNFDVLSNFHLIFNHKGDCGDFSISYTIDSPSMIKYENLLCFSTDNHIQSFMSSSDLLRLLQNGELSLELKSLKPVLRNSTSGIIIKFLSKSALIIDNVKLYCNGGVYPEDFSYHNLMTTIDNFEEKNILEKHFSLPLKQSKEKLELEGYSLPSKQDGYINYITLFSDCALSEIRLSICEASTNANAEFYTYLYHNAEKYRNLRYYFHDNKKYKYYCYKIPVGVYMEKISEDCSFLHITSSSNNTNLIIVYNRNVLFKTF